MWLAGWAVRVLLLITSPVYYLCRFLADSMSLLDQWAWRAIHARDPKKPPQSENAQKQPQENANKILP
jgi:hypothetical protein